LETIVHSVEEAVKGNNADRKKRRVQEKSRNERFEPYADILAVRTTQAPVYIPTP
jgi:hypothetical protein